ncbi:DevR family CRISPR-associated autoregulator [Candidatus Aerophobetes bacterium]|nr:DevR family CRISPR-associated autoregulator [Candidatus Aerophobetes bacterium]
MLKYVTFGVKVQLNVHDLNNEAVAGNVTDIRIMDFLDENGEKREAPAVSGRMLKHWHYEAMRHLILNGGYSSLPLCNGCRMGEPIRPGDVRSETLVQIARPEGNSVSVCTICDIHGYLIAQGAQQEGERGASARRTSRAMFSWLMPVLGTDFSSKQVVHTRVSQQQAMAEGEGAAQMIFNKSYASGIYAFVSALDVERIGLVELNLGTNKPYAIEDSDRKQRAKVAIEAYRYLISGQMGASLSHAIPHTQPIEILAAYSETSPLPFPISPIYNDYIKEYKGLVPNNTSILLWNQTDEKVEGVTMKSTINEVFAEILDKLASEEK